MDVLGHKGLCVQSIGETSATSNCKLSNLSSCFSMRKHGRTLRLTLIIRGSHNQNFQTDNVHRTFPLVNYSIKIPNNQPFTVISVSFFLVNNLFIYGPPLTWISFIYSNALLAKSEVKKLDFVRAVSKCVFCWEFLRIWKDQSFFKAVVKYLCYILSRWKVRGSNHSVFLFLNTFYTFLVLYGLRPNGITSLYNELSL